MEIVYLVAGLFIGFLIGWLLSARKSQVSHATELNSERMLKQDVLIAEARLMAENQSLSDKLDTTES